MRFIKELLLAAIFTAVFFVVLMALLPSKARVERSLDIHHPPVQVYDVVKSFRQFPTWSPWRKRDPGISYTFSEASSGPGARASWVSSRDPYIGSGSMEVVEQREGELIRYSLDAPFRGETKTVDLRLRENETGGVLATMVMEVDYGWDLIGRVHGMYLESHVGDDLLFSLAQVKTRVESLPDVDYSDDYEETPPVLVTMNPKNVIQINGQAATNQPYSIQPTVRQFTQTLVALIDIQRLTRTGPRLAVLNRYGQNYDFTAAIPIEETEADLPENVSFGVIQGGNYLKVAHVGARWDLPRQRDMLMAWAGANGYRTNGSLFEEFLNDTGGEGENGLREADLETNLYLPVH